MDYPAIYRKVEIHLTELFESSHDPKQVYHNLQHTQKVVARTQEIAGQYNISEPDLFVLYSAAWFHDTGYLVGGPDGHEERSVQLMKDFFSSQGIDDHLIGTATDCILATRENAAATTLLQQIMADADTFNFGTKEFEATNKLVYKEYMLRYGHISKHDWNQQTLKLLRNHHYHTSYCKEILAERKRKNIIYIRKSLEESKDDTAEQGVTQPERKAVVRVPDFKSKGIQTMLRFTFENQIKLGDICDRKANNLISANAVIVSIILLVLLRRVQFDVYLIIPALLLLLSSVATIIIATLATRPHSGTGVFSDQDVADKETNPLFFGNFYKTPPDEYEKAIAKMMADPDYLYGSVVKDIYRSGVALARKHNLTRWAYNIFMVGVVVAIIAFVLAAIFNDGASSGF